MNSLDTNQLDTMFIDKLIENKTNLKLQDRYLQEYGLHNIGYKNLPKFSKTFKRVFRLHKNSQFQLQIQTAIVVYTR